MNNDSDTLQKINELYEFKVNRAIEKESSPLVTNQTLGKIYFALLEQNRLLENLGMKLDRLERRG